MKADLSSRPMTVNEALQELCSAKRCYGMVIYIDCDDWMMANRDKDLAEEIRKVSGGTLDYEVDDQVIIDHTGVFLFPTREEMEAHYLSMVGEDGPTKLNQYDGELHVTALTCNDQGELENYNT